MNRYLAALRTGPEKLKSCLGNPPGHVKLKGVQTQYYSHFGVQEAVLNDWIYD